MNVLIPCSGNGSRFKEEGYKQIKPLIPIANGRAMIECVGRNLDIKAHHIFVVQEEHWDMNYEKMSRAFENISEDYEVIKTNGVTEGAACSCLLAKDVINTSEPLIIANSDQYVFWDRDFFLSMLKMYDGAILTFTSNEKKWSYVEVTNSCLVKRTAEKDPISSRATVGIYAWSKGSDFVESAEAMLQDNVRVNGEFYVCPTFNWMINKGKKVIAVECRQMFGLGTPHDLRAWQEEFKGLV